MKAVVIEIFQDKFTNELHKVGSTVDFDAERTSSLKERGLVRVVEDAEPLKSTTEGKKTKNDRIGKSGRK